MSKLNDEKYISIEYETWKNKYLPLEETVEKLKKELETEKKNKTITINLGTASLFHSYRRHSYNYDFEDKVIGFLYENGITEINEQVRISALLAISDSLGIMTEQQAKEWSDKIKSQHLNVNKEVDKILIMTQDNAEKYKKIPKFIRWMFNIKL